MTVGMSGGTTHHHHDAVIGTVAGRGVPAELLEQRLSAMYASPAAVALPARGDMEWRRLRRWVAQLLLTEALVRAEADRLGVTAEAAPPADVAEAVRLAATGSLAAAVLSAQPLARALFDRVSTDIDVDESAVRAYYDRNPDRWRQPARCRLRHLLADDEDGARRAIDRLDGEGEVWSRPVDDLPRPLGAAIAGAEPGTVVGPVASPFGWHVVRVDELRPAGIAPYDEVRPGIADTLRKSAQADYFERWLERRRREQVEVAEGYEHPGSPNQPDFAHHH
jgi:[acyl-carrier-protein] S-malonyltransferase